MKNTHGKSKAFLALSTLFLVAVFTLFISNSAIAQSRKGEFIDVSVGYGISATYDQEEDNDIIGTGFYAQGEYVYGISNWFALRPYAGVIFTKADDDEPDYKVTSNAFLIGGKARLTIPIPWVAPYLETGIGTSIGSFKTITANTQIEDSGLFIHIPFSIGLELGRNHNVDIEFTYYYHSSVKQFSGAAAIGISIPINRGQ